MATTIKIWQYRDPTAATHDVVGYDVEATDGHIGKIDKASNETSRAYLVVDTGFWIFGKKRMIPAGVVSRTDHDNRKVFVNMTKDEVKSAPDFEDQHSSNYGDEYYESSGRYYDQYGW